MTYEEMVTKADNYAAEAERLSHIPNTGDAASTMALLATYWLRRADMLYIASENDTAAAFLRGESV